MEDFLQLSEWIGLNWYLCQANGGNTSIKIDNRVYIKASGKRLSESISDTKNVFLYLDDPKSHLKPSMETQMHLSIDKKYVIHYHPLNTLLCTVLKKSHQLIKNLEKNNIKTICLGYAEPGFELNKLICQNLSKLNYIPELILLENHGVIIAENNIQNIYKIINILEIETSKLLNECGIDVKYLSEICSETFIKSGMKYLKLSSRLLKIIFKGLEKVNDQSFFFPDQIVFLDSTYNIWRNLNEDFSHGQYISYDQKKQLLIVNKSLNDIQKNYLWASTYLLFGLGMTDIKKISMLNDFNANSIINNPAEIYRKITI